MMLSWDFRELGSLTSFEGLTLEYFRSYSLRLSGFNVTRDVFGILASLRQEPESPLIVLTHWRACWGNFLTFGLFAGMARPTHTSLRKAVCGTSATTSGRMSISTAAGARGERPSASARTNRSEGGRRERTSAKAPVARQQRHLHTETMTTVNSICGDALRADGKISHVLDSSQIFPLSIYNCLSHSAAWRWRLFSSTRTWSYCPARLCGVDVFHFGRCVWLCTDGFWADRRWPNRISSTLQSWNSRRR